MLRTTYKLRMKYQMSITVIPFQFTEVSMNSETQVKVTSRNCLYSSKEAVAITSLQTSTHTRITQDNRITDKEFSATMLLRLE